MELESKMLTKEQALALLTRKLERIDSSRYDPVVDDRNTIERPFGWVFYYNSRKFIETGSDRYRLLGPGPVIVDRHSGVIKFFGSDTSDEEAIEEYERELEGGRGQSKPK